MIVLAADRYRHFVPSASDLIFQMPSFSLDGTRTINYQYIHGGFSALAIPQQVLEMPELHVFIDNLEQTDWYLHNGVVVFHSWTHVEVDDSIDPPPQKPPLVVVTSPGNPTVGSKIRVQGKDSSGANGFRHLDIRRLLIQGANPWTQDVLDAGGGFQGGYRLKHIRLSDPHYGEVQECAYHLGWEYKPPNGFEGLDSFSYCFETEFGQRSDAACVYIYVGISP